MNSFKPHILVLPEDAADHHLALGFFLYPGLSMRNFCIAPKLGGWSKVLAEFEEEQITQMRKFKGRVLVMLIDFDKNSSRIEKFHEAIPSDLKDRVFVLGVWSNPEALQAPHGCEGLEQHGSKLADDCANNNRQDYWQAPLFKHNLAELNGRDDQLKKILFG
ncbi:MAG: hypothetical protein WAO71_10230 [Gallionella sp.]